MIPAIANRRSIRKYKDLPISRQAIEEILHAGMLAPSSKNRQPWKFIVITGNSKTEMLSVMKRGMDREKREPLLPESAQLISGAEYTVKIMEQAPVVVLIANPIGINLYKSIGTEDRIYEICNAQSVGAAIENMTLTATALGLGSLWICDTFFAYPELREWLGAKGELFAALAIGRTDEEPAARPRKKPGDIVEWRT